MPRPRALSLKDAQAALVGYKLGRSLRALAGQYDVSYGCIRETIWRLGGAGAMRPRGGRRRGSRSAPNVGSRARALLNQKIVTSYQADPATVTEMAARHKISEKVVMQALDEAGVPRVKFVNQGREKRAQAGRG